MRQRNLVATAVLAAILVLGGSCTRRTADRRDGGATAIEIPVPRPPMGWSSWNSFSNTINSKIVMAQARAMVATGMQKLGYQYVNIDEGWWLGDRDSHGNIVVDPAQWPALTPGERPGDMANIVKYIHSLGLKAGIYTDAGESGCGFYGPDIGPPRAHTGSEGHYEQDFLQFAKWGFDYVKVDWCGGYKENLDPAIQYAEVARAIRKAESATGHRMFYSICDWGKNSPWTWAPGIGGVSADIWRTSGDIVAPIVANGPHSNRKASFKGMLGNFDKGIHPAAEHTGFYNDPDMMVIGMPGLTDSQNRVHMTLWAISGAPLIVGADLTTLSPATLATLTNPEVIAVDQDPLGLQGVKVSGGGSGLEVWAKRLAQASSGEARRAVVLLNRTASAAPITVQWRALGLEPKSASVRDLWSHKELAAHAGSYTTTVAANDAVMLVVTGREKNAVRYLPLAPAKESPMAAGGHRRSVEGKRSPLAHEIVWAFPGVRSLGTITWIEIAYTNAAEAHGLAKLRVNDQTETTIAFPPTGKGRTGSIVIEADLKPHSDDNTLTLSAPRAEGITLNSISVLASPE
jgi:Alpha galactosidase A/Alpha galactosidase C-terminal beta sandwich domain/Alpha-galactosidase, CBM13 domain